MDGLRILRERAEIRRPVQARIYKSVPTRYPEPNTLDLVSDKLQKQLHRKINGWGDLPAEKLMASC